MIMATSKLIEMIRITMEEELKKSAQKEVDNLMYNLTSFYNQTMNSKKSCYEEHSIQFLWFDWVLLFWSFIFILLLALFAQRSKSNNCCGKHFGILVPVDFLVSEENRFSIGLAFGATTVSCMNLFLGTGWYINIRKLFLPANQMDDDLDVWLKSMWQITEVLMVVIIEFPIFGCLTTRKKILGAVIGFSYTTARFVRLTIPEVVCFDRPEDYYPSAFVPHVTLLINLPLFVCLFMLILRFAWIFSWEIKKKLGKVYDLRQECKKDLVASSAQFLYVKQLLKDDSNRSSTTKSWYQQLRDDFLYTPRKDFKYSTQLVATMVVAFILFYQTIFFFMTTITEVFIISQEIWLNYETELKAQLGSNYEVISIIIQVLGYTCIGSCIISGLLTLGLMINMPITHRKHVLRMYSGDKRFLPDELPTGYNLVGYSLRYSGYQVAYLLWGFMLSFFVIWLICIIIAVFVLLGPVLMPEKFMLWFRVFAVDMTPMLFTSLMIWLVQKILALMVFKRWNSPPNYISIDNRHLYQLFQFIFFFFNVIVGLVTCLLRVILGMFLGLIFLGRIDRCGILQGFEYLDFGYMAYMGFLHVQVKHKNPILRVFCQVLSREIHERRKGYTPSLVTTSVIKNRDVELEEKGSNVKVKNSSPARFRWWTAITLINNPILLQDRRKRLKCLGKAMSIPVTDETSSILVQNGKNGISLPPNII